MKSVPSATGRPAVYSARSRLQSLLPLSLTILTLMFNSPVRAQVVNDGTTNILINVTNTFVGNVSVGTNGPFTTLILSTNSLLTNSLYSIVGVNATSSSNEVSLIAPTARWNMGAYLFVGSNGPCNLVVVSNGARVRALATIMSMSPASTNNLAVITGPGSSMTNLITCLIGNGGPGNRLVVSDGGLFRCDSASVIGNAFSSSNNIGLVTGSNSLWSLPGDLNVGLVSGGNQLVVSEGARARNGNGFVGGAISASNNLAFITGAGSSWSNLLDLKIGAAGTGNELIASNGATVSVLGTAFIGYTNGSTGSSVTLTDPGTRWFVGNNLYLGSNGPSSRLIISNGALLVNGDGILGLQTGSSNNTALITGPNSTWSNRTELTIGNASTGNLLVISNGGFVDNTAGYVGRSASGALAIVNGTGSYWNNRSDLYVGFNVGGNRMVVEDGGVVAGGNQVYLGFNIFVHSNSVLVTGAGSLLSNRLDLTLGLLGSTNQLVVSNGGWVVNSNGIFGSHGNFGLVTGSGSTWSNRADLIVGTGGLYNQLTVSNGGTVSVSGNASIGTTSSARSNTVTLTDAGSRWLITSNLFVGSNGVLSQLIVGPGAFVLSSNATLGATLASSNHLVMVTGAGALWTNRYLLNIGGSGPGNQLVISNGARVHSYFANIGLNPSSSNNEVLVTGTNSFFKVHQGVPLGYSGGGNRVIITNGARMATAGVTIGYSSGANNEVVVTGPGSALTNGSTLSVGSVTSGNRLIITNGGLVFEQPFGVVVGNSSSSFSNRLVVHGGTLRANNAGSGILEVRRGTNVLNAGLIEVDQVLITNLLGVFEFNGGTLATETTRISNGIPFRVGNGVSPAVFNFMSVTGVHSFANGLILSSNASLIGSGIIAGTLTAQSGSLLSPGASVGSFTLSNSPTLQGAIRLELAKTGAALTNDQIQVTGSLNYGGSLIVTNLGPATLEAGDNFRLFPATSYSGSFTNLTLPSLGAGLGWINKLLVDGSIEVGVQLSSQSNITLRVMAANLTSGNNQRYETPGLNIFQGLAPDIVALQEFNVSNSFGLNTTNAISNTVATTFGPGFSWFREPGAYSIPNGIISRYPILTNDSWVDTDTGVNDRGYAWALIDLPGTNNLYVVSVHLKASSGGANEVRRAAEAAELKDLITTNFPPNAWVIVAGDMNLYSETEQAIVTFKTFLSDSPVPDDQNGDTDTNAGRDERYDRVLPSFSMTNQLIPLVMPSRTYTNGLVFDSRVYTPLSEVAPVQFGDSGASNMQHMAVVKTFNISVSEGSVIPFAHGDRFWTNSLGGNYHDATNWLHGVLPNAIDTAHFTNNASYQVNWLANALSSNAVFNARSGVLTEAIGSSLWSVTNTYIVGRDSTATATVAHVSGKLFVTNSAVTAQLKVGEAGKGTFNLSGGEVFTDNLLVTNGAKSTFNLSGGTLRSRKTTVSFSSGTFVMGGASVFELLGGVHVFQNSLSSQLGSLLAGTGTISANVSLNGSVSPGPVQGGIGRLDVNSGALNFLPPCTNFFEINAATDTNDVIVSTSTMSMNGALVVTNLAGTLGDGHRFQLFSGGFVSAGFSKITLPPLDPGLSWRNRTRKDGSIDVVTTPARDFGVDVSHWQGESGVSQSSWDQMFAEGKRFAFIKATEGLTGPHDPTMATNVQRAVAAGILVGVYHHAHPENRPNIPGAISEASNFVAMAGDAIGPGRLRPVLVIESGTAMTSAELTDWIIAFSNEITNNRGAAAAPIIYTLQFIAIGELDARLADYDVWIRSVTGAALPDADDPPPQSSGTNATGVFNNWAFWQYSDVGNSGGITPLDLDVCHSEYKPLESYLIPGPPVTSIQIAGVLAESDGTIQINFTNTPGESFTILAATNVNLPLSNWTILGSPTESPPGQYQFIDNSLGLPKRFYRVRSP